MMPCRCAGKGYRADGYVVNLSYVGAGIASARTPHTSGIELTLTIRPMIEKIELRSRVVWINSRSEEDGPATYGVEFVDALEARKEKIRVFFPKYYGGE